MSTHTPLQPWARHLAVPPAAAGQAPRTALTLAEAARVERYRDQLMAALRARDRAALRNAKQQVLEAAFRPHTARGGEAHAPSPALRQALRDLSWRMAGVLLVRGADR